MIEIVLILEDNDTKYHHICGSSDDLEALLLTIDLTKYCYANIVYREDDECNHKISKLYKERYLKTC
jgi:hypothetical protein